jgi:Fur family ferric uptake transcriptional regulator
MLKDELTIEDYKTILKEKGLKCTSTRLDIIKIFLKNHKPISADFIFNKLLESIDEATVYRTLSSFEKSGILKRVDLRKDSIHFELNNDHHHHIVCIKCGDIEDFKENIEIEKQLQQIIGKSIRFKNITEHSLELFGLCKDCN